MNDTVVLEVTVPARTVPWDAFPHEYPALTLCETLVREFGVLYGDDPSGGVVSTERLDRYRIFDVSLHSDRVLTCRYGLWDDDADESDLASWDAMSAGVRDAFLSALDAPGAVAGPGEDLYKAVESAMATTAAGNRVHRETQFTITNLRLSPEQEDAAVKHSVEGCVAAGAKFNPALLWTPAGESRLDGVFSVSCRGTHPAVGSASPLDRRVAAAFAAMASASPSPLECAGDLPVCAQAARERVALRDQANPAPWSVFDPARFGVDVDAFPEPDWGDLNAGF